jgi:hypothetical protein
MLLLLLLASACSSRNDAESTPYDQLFEHKMPIKEMLADTLKKYGGSSFNITHASISNGSLVGVLSEPEKDINTYYFFLADLKTAGKLKVIPNPFSQLQFYTLSIATANGKIYAMATERESLLYSYDPATGTLDSSDISSFNIGDPAFISVFNNTLFAYGSVYGSCMYEFSSKRSLCFKHAESVASFNYATVSLPLSASFNLVSGKRVSGDTVTIYRVDSSLNVHAQFGVKESRGNTPFKMLTFDSGYAIANERELILLDKQTLKEKWHTNLGLVIDDAISISASELLIVATTFEDGKFGTTYVQKTDILTGVSKWKIPVGNSYYKGRHIAALRNNRIVVTDQTDVVIIDAADGKVLKKHPYKDTQKFSFGLITDEVTGTNYYFNDNSILYW